MFPEANNISDVTLAPRDNQSKSSHQPICKYNQSGFTKFGERCNKMQINTVCKNLLAQNPFTIRGILTFASFSLLIIPVNSAKIVHFCMLRALGP